LIAKNTAFYLVLAVLVKACLPILSYKKKSRSVIFTEYKKAGLSMLENENRNNDEYFLFYLGDAVEKCLL